MLKNLLYEMAGSFFDVDFVSSQNFHEKHFAFFKTGKRDTSSFVDNVIIAAAAHHCNIVTTVILHIRCQVVK